MASLGTFKNTGSGVTLSRRGVGVILDVSYKSLEAWAKKNGIDEKRLWRRSYGRACNGLKAKFKKIMSHGGGVEGVPKFKDFEAFTTELRTATNRTSPMGGVLADKRNIVAYKRGDTQYIGWPDRLAEWAVNFQDAKGGAFAEAFLTDDASRHRLHKLGLQDIPRVYQHNPRRVIPEPFGTYVKKHLEEWAKGSFYKELARQMAKKRFSAA